MSRHLTVRSPLAILAALTSTGLFAAIVVLGWVYVRGRAVGTDWLLVYGLPLVATILLLLPLRLRLVVSSEGIAVRNLVVGERIRWPDVEAVTVNPLAVTVLVDRGFFAPGVVVQKHNGRVIEAYATWGLPRARRRKLAEALAVAALEHGFHNAVDADALKLRRGGDSSQRDPVAAVSAPPRDETIWSGDMLRETDSEVDCVMCGRRASPSEMESFGEEGEAIAWYCREGFGCAKQHADAGATPDETKR